MLDKVLSTVAKLYIAYFIMEVILTFLGRVDIDWVELNLFGVSGLYLSLRYINTIKRKSNEPIS